MATAAPSHPATRLLRTLALGSWLGMLPAQSPGAANARPPAAPAPAAASACGVMEHQGALLGTARSYRATFGARDVEFLPALGRSAPRAEPWHLRLSSIRRGDTLVLSAQDLLPERTHDRRTVSYRWPDVVEHYEATPAGLEQSFHFAAPPRGAGDLVVRVAVATALPHPTGTRLAWRTPGVGGVALGAVTGIDAHGHRCAGSARAVEGGYELSLPAAFVDRASYPLVLDPLIATAVEALPNADCDFPDIAYDAFSDTCCVVWTQFFGGGTTGVVGSVFRRSDLSLVLAFAVNQPGDEDSVRVCNIAGSGLFVMVWVNYTSAGSSISGLAFEPSQAQATSVWTLYGPGSVQMPVVSGEATVFDDDCLVLWIDGTYGLLGSTVAIDQQLQVSATPIAQIAGGNATEPSVSKSGGNPGVHVITWVDRPPGLPGWVRAQVVDHDLNLLGPGVWVQNAPQDCGWPAVDGDGFVFLVAWEQQETQNPSAIDLQGRLLTVGTGGVTSQGAVQDLVQRPNDLDIAPDVAMLGDKFGLVWQSQAPTGNYYDDCWWKALSRGGLPIGAAMRLELTPGTTYRYEHAPRLIGRRAGDPATGADDGVVVFADQNVQTADSNVGLQAVESMGPGGTVVDLGGGCGPGGLAVATGPCALGNATFQFELFGAQPLAVPFLLLGVPGPLQTCGVCSAIQPWSSAFVPNLAGYAQSTMALPGDVGLVGFQLEFQFVSFNVGYVGCPWAPGLAASNIVRATIDY